jgi:hypothetical protein
MRFSLKENLRGSDTTCRDYSLHQRRERLDSNGEEEGGLSDDKRMVFLSRALYRIWKHDLFYHRAFFERGAVQGNQDVPNNEIEIKSINGMLAWSWKMNQILLRHSISKTLAKED